MLQMEKPLNGTTSSTPSVEQKTEEMLQEKEPEVIPQKRSITILYGSETGNAQGLAEIFEERLSDIETKSRSSLWMISNRKILKS